jgi:hypothetical protein
VVVGAQLGDTGAVTSAARVAKNEIFFREVNEQIRRLEESTFDAEGDRRAGFICECSHGGCTTKIEATLDEYRAVRHDPTQFLVSHGHVDEENERVVRTNERFWVVEKTGLAGDLALGET